MSDVTICPRCGQGWTGLQYHGPCPTCREELNRNATHRAAVRNLILFFTGPIPTKGYGE